MPQLSVTTPSSLPISETFVSIQGEGKLTGVPSLFIRLSGCNLRCAWCDTPYASWSPDGSPRTIDELIAWARETNVRHAVLTGGEPMMFRQLCELSSRLAAPIHQGGADLHITIETAGTLIPTDERWLLTCDLLSISPKLANSTPHNDPRDPGNVWSQRHEERRINIEILTELLSTFADHQLKFVVSTPANLVEIDALLKQLPPIPPSDVLLMPEGVTPPTFEQRQFVIEACTRHGFRYCPRLHIELFGNVRGT